MKYLATAMLLIMALLVFGQHYAKAHGYVIIKDATDYLVSPDMADYMQKQGHGKQFSEGDME